VQFIYYILNSSTIRDRIDPVDQQLLYQGGHTLVQFLEPFSTGPALFIFRKSDESSHDLACVTLCASTRRPPFPDGAT